MYYIRDKGSANRMKNQIYLDFSEMQPTFETKSQSYEHKLRPPNLVVPFLSHIIRAPAIATRLYCKVNPDDGALLLYQQFVVVLAVLVADIQQNRCIAQRLFHPDAADVHGTARQVVARRDAPYRFVHLWASEP